MPAHSPLECPQCDGPKQHLQTQSSVGNCHKHHFLSTCTVIMGHCLQSVVEVAHSSVCIVTMCTAAVMSQCVISYHRPTQYTRHIHMYMYYTWGGGGGGGSRVHTNPPQAYSISSLALNQRHTGPWHASTRHSDHSLRCWLPGV